MKRILKSTMKRVCKQFHLNGMQPRMQVRKAGTCQNGSLGCPKLFFYYHRLTVKHLADWLWLPESLHGTHSRTICFSSFTSFTLPIHWVKHLAFLNYVSPSEYMEKNARFMRFGPDLNKACSIWLSKCNVIK